MTGEILTGVGYIIGGLILGLGGREGIKRLRERNGRTNGNGSPPIPVRLNAVELDVREMKSDIQELKAEVREQRRDQLDQWKWQAQQAGATVREHALDKRIRELEKQV